MQTAIKTSIEQRSGPSPAAFSTLMRRIEQEKQAQKQQPAEPTKTSWWATVESAFRSLFEVQWVPALASVLIVGQAFLLLSLLGAPEKHQGQRIEPVIERGILQGIPQEALLKIRIGFQADAQEQHIREFLHTIKGQIIAGPSSDGTYTITVPQQDTMRLEALLNELRQNIDLIRLAEPFH